MAKSAPCQRCKQVPDAHFGVINRGLMPWQYQNEDGTNVVSINLCVHCFIVTAAEMQQLLDQVAALEAAQPAPEPVLEQIEHDEVLEPVAPAEGSPKGRKSKPAAQSPNGQEVTEAAPAAHE